MKIFPKEIEFFQRIRQSLEMKVVEEVLEDRESPWTFIQAGRRSGKNALLTHFISPKPHLLLCPGYDFEAKLTLEKVTADRQKIFEMLEKISPKRAEWGSSTAEFAPGDSVEIHPNFSERYKGPAKVIQVKLRDVLIRLEGSRKTIAMAPNYLRRIITKDDGDFV